jgi:hypothetical protein
MITRLQSNEAIPRLLARHLLHVARSSVLLGSLLLSSRSAFAQATASTLTDASVLPRHTLGVRLLTSWSRFDELAGNGGTRNLAASFNVDSLNGTQLNQLGFTQDLIRVLSGSSAFRITAGNLVAAANSRVLTAPLILEYGVTSKLSIGVVIPLVETRTTLGAQLNRRPGAANVGPNPAFVSGDYSANSGLVTSLRGAATALQNKLTQCQATPSGTGCSTLLAQQSAAQSLIQSTGPFATAIEELYGTSSSAPGLLFVPLAGSDVQGAIGARIQQLAQQYQALGATSPTGTLSAAGGPAANAFLNVVLQRSGYDTLQSPDRSSIGDITIGATYQLANSFDSSRVGGGLRYRVAINAAGRLGTGQPANSDRLFDNPTGTGQPGLILGAAADLAFSTRFLVSGIGSYTMNFGTAPGGHAPNPGLAVFPLNFPNASSRSAGNIMALSAVPRLRIAGNFSAFGNYTVVRTAADEYQLIVPPGIFLASSITLPGGSTTGVTSATAQQAGFGFAYSTITRQDRNPGAIPFEVSFRHLETLAASGGPVPKVFEDQLQLRVFFR